MRVSNAKFTVGQLVMHKLFNYRGVIVDVDPCYQGTEDWYNRIALTRPPKDKPWYRILVHDGTHETYAAERNLEADDSGAPINHPLISDYFDAFAEGRYVSLHRKN